MNDLKIYPFLLCVCLWSFLKDLAKLGAQHAFILTLFQTDSQKRMLSSLLWPSRHSRSEGWKEMWDETEPLALLSTFLQFLSVHFNLNRILLPCFSSPHNNISLQRLWFFSKVERANENVIETEEELWSFLAWICFIIPQSDILTPNLKHVITF